MTTAKAIRNLVGKLANINPSEIKLAEKPISPDFVPQNNCGHSWWGGASEMYDTIYGINLEESTCEKLLIDRDYEYSENGRVITEKGQELAKYLAKTQEHYHMFLVLHEGKEYGEEGERYSYWMLYKAPDFKEYWKNVDQRDIERWKQWLNQ